MGPLLVRAAVVRAAALQAVVAAADGRDAADVVVQAAAEVVGEEIGGALDRLHARSPAFSEDCRR